MNRQVVFAIVLAGVFAGTGCAQREIYPVRGKVTYSDGTPLTTGRVVVETPGRDTGSWGGLRLDGTFDIGTYSHNDGAPKGTWRVTVENAYHMDSGKPLIDERYMHPDTSGLTFTVPDQSEWLIVVQRPGY